MTTTTTLPEKEYKGLPLESRSWTLAFDLLGVASEPTNITVRLSRTAGGITETVATYTKADTDVLISSGTGRYTLRITPNDYGHFEVQIYTSGDDDTVHSSIEFDVHQPKGSYV